jgi:hypothetical protein
MRNNEHYIVLEPHDLLTYVGIKSNCVKGIRGILAKKGVISEN